MANEEEDPSLARVLQMSIDAEQERLRIQSDQDREYQEALIHSLRDTPPKLNQPPSPTPAMLSMLPVEIEQIFVKIEQIMKPNEVFEFLMGNTIDAKMIMRLNPFLTSIEVTLIMNLPVEIQQIVAKIGQIMTQKQVFQVVMGNEIDEQIIMRLQQTLTLKEVYLLMKLRATSSATSRSASSLNESSRLTIEQIEQILAKIQLIMTPKEVFDFMMGNVIDDQLIIRLNTFLTSKELTLIMNIPVEIQQIVAKIHQIMTPKQVFQVVMGNVIDDELIMRLEQNLTSIEVYLIMKLRATSSGTSSSASVLTESSSSSQNPCSSLIWAALTKSQRECFMDGLGNIVVNPIEGPGIKNLAVKKLLNVFFGSNVPTKDPCPNSLPADTPKNREAAWDVLCREMPDNAKDTLRDEALDFAVFDDPVILSHGNTYSRESLTEWVKSQKRDPIGLSIKPEELVNLVSNTRLKRFIDTFNLGGRPDRKAMLGGRKLIRTRKSKSKYNKKSKSSICKLSRSKQKR
jgi:hypothetical protein